MKKIISLFILVCSIAAPAFAQQPEQTITLKDGTSIKGHLSGITNGSYSINNATMGEIKVPASEVLSITAAGVNPTIALPANSGGKINNETLNSVKTNMMQDPEIMNLIQELLKDPEIAEIIKNPSLLQDALSMDPQKIENNPDMQKLMQNPTMQKILKATAGKMQNSATR